MPNPSREWYLVVPRVHRLRNDFPGFSPECDAQHLLQLWYLFCRSEKEEIKNWPNYQFMLANISPCENAPAPVAARQHLAQP